MWGQWLGRINGTNQAAITLNIDRDRPLAGRLMVSEDTPGFNPYYCNVQLAVNGDEVTAKLTNFYPFTFSGSPSTIPVNQAGYPTAGELSGKIEAMVSAFAAASWPTDTPCGCSALPSATAKNCSFISVRLLFGRRESSQTMATH